MTTSIDCLHLDDELGDVWLLEAVEAAFAIKFTSDELSLCDTVGGLFDIVMLKFSVKTSNRGFERIPCPTALTFYRLRSALRRAGYSDRLTPSTDLNLLYRRGSAERLHQALGRETGLRLPDTELHPEAVVFLLFLVAASLGLTLTVGSMMPILAGIGLATGLAYLLPRQLPDRIATTKDFVRYSTALNFAELAQQTGGARQRDVWTALTSLISEVADSGPYSLIGRETRLFSK
jgi:hypothetical protein